MDILITLNVGYCHNSNCYYCIPFSRVFNTCTYHDRFESSNGSDLDTDDDQPKSIKPVCCIGRQPDSEVFVLGPKVQFWSDGRVLKPEDSEYKFIPKILDQLGLLRTIRPVEFLPHVVMPLQAVADGIFRVGGENAICGLFCLGMFLCVQIPYRVHAGIN